MQAEREDDKGIAWFINWVYGTFASYGTNPGRPITWILGFYVIIVLAAHCGDASSFNASFGQVSALYKTLASPEEGRWHRAWMLPLQSAVNPFGVFFDGRKVLMPNSLWWGIVLTVYGIISDLLLLMFIFCVRRRFKVN